MKAHMAELMRWIMKPPLSSEPPAQTQQKTRSWSSRTREVPVQIREGTSKPAPAKN